MRGDMYDIIVAGAGHAGCEAVLAAARSGASCLLISSDLTAIARMSCNPAIGGIAKGQITREIDALGGEMAKAIDATGIHFRLLNRSKGPAMHSPRAQADKTQYSLYMRHVIESEVNIDLLQDTVIGIGTHDGSFHDVMVTSGRRIRASSAILTCGTFLNGLIHIGMRHFPGGRSVAEPPVHGMTQSLASLGFTCGRLKTGTPPRIDARSVNYNKVMEQKGDPHPVPFSFSTNSVQHRNLVSCHITNTTSQTHTILREGFDRSPLFTGKVKGTGPRYCPSVEDKISRFPDKESHHIFLEPEGTGTNEMYVNGFSTSLPEDIQLAGLRSVPGLEQVKMIRPGYAIEYDYFHPWQIDASLETKLVQNLYFAGQINGTSGYEEAAAQGLMAGINASLKLRKLPPLILGRSDAYIGVLIDDIITKESNEPYRMFTSSAEHRLLLRHDNADLRLRIHGYRAGLVSKTELDKTQRLIDAIQRCIVILKETRIYPDHVNHLLRNHGYPELSAPSRAFSIVKRPGICLNDLVSQCSSLQEAFQEASICHRAAEQAEFDIRYEGYIKREQLMTDRINRLESLPFPVNFDVDELTSLSSEGREKLKRHKPSTIGQASRISGVSPSDISLLMIRFGR